MIQANLGLNFVFKVDKRLAGEMALSCTQEDHTGDVAVKSRCKGISHRGLWDVKGHVVELQTFVAVCVDEWGG